MINDENLRVTAVELALKAFPYYDDHLTVLDLAGKILAFLDSNSAPETTRVDVTRAGARIFQSNAAIPADVQTVRDIDGWVAERTSGGRWMYVRDEGEDPTISEPFDVIHWSFFPVTEVL
jgi:hypothetical protein